MSATATLTDEQALALTTRETSIALAAGAGCGKTFVLSERFLSHLEQEKDKSLKPAELHQLIAITFTDAAAREMRRRIRDKCYERSRNATSPESQDYWLRLLRAIEAARVSTIHAFCASLLREHAVEAGLDPAFGVLEQGEADVLQSEVIDDVLRTQLAAGDEVTLQLAAASGLSRLKDQLRELLKYRHDDEFQRWRAASADDVLAAWQKGYDSEAFPAAIAELATAPEIRVICELLQSVTPSASREKFVRAKTELLANLPRMEREELNMAELQATRQFVGVAGICTAKDWPNAKTFDEYKNACKRLREEIDKCLKLQFDPDAAREVAELGLVLLTLAHGVSEEYDRRKVRQSTLDFDDLLAGAFRLLTGPEQGALGTRLSSELRLLLVDEFQDTDRLQVELVQALCGDLADGKLFVVGDINQSIYRFRGAQPDVFRDLRDRTPKQGQLPLTRNFRSQPAILNFVNALFRQALGDEYQPLRPNRTQVTAEPAVEFLWTIAPDKKNRALKGAARLAREQEARRIARRLRELLEGGEPLIADAASPGGMRPLMPGDVAILFRALSDVDLYEAALREYELDYYLVGGHAFYAQQEIYDVLNLLRSVASPADEISLAGVLRSPFFSLADETLFWLVESAGSLNAGLFGDRLPAELSTDERIKATAAVETLVYLRARKDSVPITSLLADALARTGYDAALLAEFLGDRKLANLYKLLEQARTADSGNALDLAGFIAQLAEFVVRAPKEALAATQSESADVIRLMTIHYAKGLEFPMVIVPDLDRKPDFRTPAAALDARLGPVVSPRYDDEDDRPTTGIDLYRALEKRAELEERKRLLYVAATRAADYLILSSSVAGYGDNELESDWMKLLAEWFDLATGRLRAPLPSGYAAPQIRVTDSDPATDFKPTGKSRGPDLLRIVEEARDLAASGGGIVPDDVVPIPPDASARRQFSVSRLSGQFIRLDARAASLIPSPAAVDSLGLGTLVHAVLERIDFRGSSRVGPLCEQLAAELVVPNVRESARLAAAMIERFTASPRWSQIAAAKSVHRELEFLLAWPPGDANCDGHFLQGFIDCLYQDATGAWHLVDYKTNDVSPADCPSVANRYEMQMLIYAMAVERSLGKPPVELVIHFLRPGVEQVIPWNDSARQRGIELVNDAIRSAHDCLNPEP